MKRLVEADLYNQRLIISSSWTTEGNYPLFLQGDWVRVVDESVNDEEVGRLIRSALAASRDDVPYPDPRNDSDTKHRRREFLRNAGARSETEYARKACHVSVYFNDTEENMTITPHRGDGIGFEGMADKLCTVRTDSSDSELGAVIRQALSVSVAFAR
jgi:hypothetical protein